MAVYRDIGLASRVAAPDPEFRVGTQWLVLIAVGDYREWDPLRKPFRAAEEIRAILESRYHVDRVERLYDRQADKAGIMALFNCLQKDVGVHDSLHPQSKRPSRAGRPLFLYLVPKAGLEPARPVEHHPLKMACLPIPPLRRSIQNTIDAKSIQAVVGDSPSSFKRALLTPSNR